MKFSLRLLLSLLCVVAILICGKSIIDSKKKLVYYSSPLSELAVMVNDGAVLAADLGGFVVDVAEGVLKRGPSGRLGKLHRLIDLSLCLSLYRLELILCSDSLRDDLVLHLHDRVARLANFIDFLTI